MQKLAEPSSSNSDPAGASEAATSSSSAGSLIFQHAILNLPASAVDFLDVFNGLYHEQDWTQALPHVHCYTFSKGAETHAEVQQRVEAALDLMSTTQNQHLGHSTTRTVL
ncbi:hypothetical protein WJX84_002571 [Apatococcus fuscideae]|uniref:Uncharacterized protein n=1 Tax=Apatococcus fuscideae TaxID=2026836 RepID=A0AAW1RR64_9CHLO